jgi:RNA polymerase sigma-70 factor (ECF subfamily)
VRTAAHRGLKRLAELLGTDPESVGALDAVPPQRGSRVRAVTSAGVTHTRSRAQKDM